MFNIVEVLERQRLGSGVYKRGEVGFRALFGPKDGRSEELSNCPLFAARFCPVPGYKEILAVASEDGNVVVRNSSYLLSSPKTRGTYHLVRAHDNAVFDLAWSQGSPCFVTASGDHSAALWDISGPCVRHVMKFLGHTASVKTVAASPSDPNVFATGSRDGSVMLWDCRNPRDLDHLLPDTTIFNCHSPHLTENKSKGAKSITSVVFIDGNTLATCVSGQGTICLWDMRRTYKKRRPSPKYLLQHQSSSPSFKGYSCLAVSPCQLRLYASCIDETIYAYDVGTYAPKPVFSYHGHQSSSFYVKHSASPCGRYIMSGSGDSKAYIWRVGESDPAATLLGHTGEVTSACWATSGCMKVVTASEDGNYIIWSLDQEGVDLHPQLPYTCTVFPSRKPFPKPKTSCKLNCFKGFVGKKSHLSPPVKQACKKLHLESSPTKSVSSFASGLPNYVFDGASPNVSSHSGKKRRREDDWLTRLRKETPPPNKGQSATTPSPRRQHSSKSSRAKGSLIKFFCNQPRSKCDGESADLKQIPHSSMCCDKTV